MVGRICSGKVAAEPSTRTSALTAFSGTTTWAWVPPALTLAGRTVCSPRLPALSMVWKTTTVLALRPTPLSVMLWPGLAEADALAGLPLPALAVRPASVMLKTALVPPTVRTWMGPVGTSVGTTTLMRLLLL